MARAVVKFAAKVLRRTNMHKKQQYCYFPHPYNRQKNNNIANTTLLNSTLLQLPPQWIIHK